MVVIVPSYNNRNWYRYNLASITHQHFDNFRVIYIDDCSTDGTGRLVHRYITNHHLTNFTLIRNTQRRGALANIWHGITLCKPHEIIINLDGDDWFAHDHVLAYLNHIYCTQDIWLTYGQFINWPTQTPGWCKAIPKAVVKNNTFRNYGFWFAQPRTYYAWLAQRINPRDLIDPRTKNFYRVAGDAALMFAMVEMAGPHIHFIPDILYIRNVKTPLNDFKCHCAEQLRITQHLCEQPPYHRILSPKFTNQFRTLAYNHG